MAKAGEKVEFRPRARKLSDDAVRAIRGEDLRVRSLAKMAVDYRVSMTTITDIRLRKRKSHVPDVAPVDPDGLDA